MFVLNQGEAQIEGQTMDLKKGERNMKSALRRLRWLGFLGAFWLMASAAQARWATCWGCFDNVCIGGVAYGYSWRAHGITHR